ncbi:hypothetical protein DPMN_008072 [Dreissena polymorpha]|uniref:Uncharacterized protein n=1 Tax=Dreissena polymorpha TaxID=45954 RepID=A0A9D4RWZ6_DREPO|nr:hypothetical protein DPMN_008072 [Dreissena polymorpha]
MEELDALPTVEAIDQAIDPLSFGTAPGKSLHPTLCHQLRKDLLLQPLNDLLILCWE